MIQLKNIIKTYDSDVHALRGINLRIERGTVYGIVGLSGAGKSTLIRCINMLERPTSGEVLIDGRDMMRMSESELREERRHIGMIFQHFNLLSSATVYDNVAFPLRLAGRPADEIRPKVTELLTLVGLADKADAYPSHLSGGQKQRVGIARALANNPKVLLCDEATSALDPQTTKSILALIRDINRRMGLTVVVITHEMQVIKDICDRVAVIDGGIIAEEGDVVDVFTEPQQPITKEFISVLLSNDLPTAFRGNSIEREPSPGSYMLLRLTFLGKNADDPVLADMIRLFPDIEVTMLFGTLDQMKGMPFGRMIIGLRGEPSEIDTAISYLSAQHLKQEVIGYVRRNDSSAD
ncbi:methionine ABC transporter ATP-binding protein [Selenomonas sp. F0473]|uniref:methionine ABC transporter ATP-binding protein n=1 Tax=Selenomonas sp. F0473 TaxID=999423 RepID=UPI00029E2847|nr:methionine ABC transporter ATP-binding protein [Selenomonas sp. F0473]EKU70928.1 D-methionine ABC transporter, ATP-binding protein [Selenomonas sp. F0473]